MHITPYRDLRIVIPQVHHHHNVLRQANTKTVRPAALMFGLSTIRRERSGERKTPKDLVGYNFTTIYRELVPVANVRHEMLLTVIFPKRFLNELGNSLLQLSTDFRLHCLRDQ
ncbi:hypothetical protein BaRGS_00021157 [Batillaria attramentaria]|uniref:Uncharacterized protein n=1 Tax=Batillaria attramentaria TaxID=370345 RepID=A0ABD0KKK2_9CAEN